MAADASDEVLAASGFGHAPQERLAQPVGRAVRQVCLIAAIPEPVAETGWRERLAVLGDQERPDPDHRGGGDGRRQRFGDRDVELRTVLRGGVDEAAVAHVWRAEGHNVLPPFRRVEQQIEG